MINIFATLLLPQGIYTEQRSSVAMQRLAGNFQTFELLSKITQNAHWPLDS